MTRTPRVPAYSAVKVGSLLTGPQEDQYVVTRKEDGGYWTAELSDVRAFADGGAMYEDRYAPEGWEDEAYPQILAGTAPEHIVGAVRRADERAQAERAVWAAVSPSDHGRLYNALTDINRCSVRLLHRPDAPDADRMRDIRRREMERAERITGSRAAVATLLGTDEDTLNLVLES